MSPGLSLGSKSMCPACRGTRVGEVLEWPDIPVNSTLFLASQEEAVNFPRGSFRLSVCRDCGLGFNADFDPGLPEYSERNLETQLCSSGFASFATGLALEWIADHGLEGAHVLEIGAGRAGEFLQLFCELSGGTGVGLDPAALPAQNGSVRLLERPFDSAWREPADAVICRHTLEHVGDVGTFLGDLARWAHTSPAAVHLFELPDFSTILERGSFWDLYYEHASYFTADTLRAAFERNGFDVLGCRRAFDDQYLILEARLAPAPPTVSATRGQETLASAESLARQIDEVRPVYARRFQQLRKDGPIVVWQAGAKAAALLEDPRIAETVVALVDVNTAKRGRYIVGTGLPVVGPDDVPALDPAHVVVMNGVYRNEIAETLETLGSGAAVHTIESLAREGGAGDPTIGIARPPGSARRDR
ncbi:MAG TPA: class I SAM-dependent methyltransferase [Gaiellaceae bacterium]